MQLYDDHWHASETMKYLAYEESLAAFWTQYQTLSRPLVAGLPFTTFNCLHALRIGYLLRTVQLKQDGPTKRWSLAQVIVLSWFCMFGSITLAQALLGMPALWLAYPSAQVPYVLVMTAVLHSNAVFSLLDSAPALPLVRGVIETLIDGFGRVGGLTDLGIDLVANHSDPNIRNPFSMLFIATLVAGGGDILLPSLNMLSVEWKPVAPPFARMQLSPDLWSCPVVATVYAVLTHAHPWFAAMSPFAKPIAQNSAKAISAILLSSILASARLQSYFRSRTIDVPTEKKSQ